jgi:nucleoside-diphosphate-sugar epimerase
MKVAVIGASSFLASYIIEKLKNRNDSLTLYGTEPHPHYNEIPFRRFVFPDAPVELTDLLVFDAIVYTAGAGIQAGLKESSDLIFELNTFFPVRLANFLKSQNYSGKLVTFGSYFEIGNEPDEKYYAEEDLAASRNRVPNDYCVSKRLLTRYYSSTDIAFDHFHLILPNIYGKGENPERLIPYLIRSVMEDKEMKLTSGTQVRQYIHVEDVANTVTDILQSHHQPGIYNVSNPTPYRVKDVVKLVFTVLDKEEEFKNVTFGTNSRSDTNMPYLLLDTQKAISTFSTLPGRSLEEGIKTYLGETPS